MSEHNPSKKSSFPLVLPLFPEEMALAESSLKNLSIASLIVSQEGQVLRITGNMGEMLGFCSNEELQEVCVGGIEAMWDEVGDWDRLRETLVVGRCGIREVAAVLRRKDGDTRSCVFSARLAMWPATQMPVIELLAKDEAERHRGFSALTQTLRLNRDIMDLLPVPLLIHDKGRVFYANQAAESFFISPGRWSLEGRQVSDLMDVKDVASASRNTWVTEKGSPLTGEYQVVLPNDRVRWVRFFGTTTTFLGKSATLCLLQDYTRDIRSAFHQEDDEFFCQTVVENSQSAIMVHDCDVLINANSAAARLFGFANPDVMVGKRLFDLFHPNSHEFFARRWKKILSTQPTEITEFSFQLIDGETKFVRSYGMPSIFKGRPAYISIYDDLTESRSVSIRYKNLFDTVPLGIAIEDMEGNLLKVNQHMAEMFRYPSPEEMVREVMGLGSQYYASSKDYEQLNRQAFVKGEAHNQMCQCCRRDGSLFWTSIIVRVITDVTGRSIGYKFFVQDITRHRQAEKEAEERGRRIRTLSAEMTLAHELERCNLARDLHDGPVQLLALATMTIDDLARRAGLSDVFDKPLTLLRDVALQLRSNIVDLAPPALFTGGLADALVSLAYDFRMNHSLVVEVVCTNIPNLFREGATFLFRAAREFLMNAVKHGRATRAMVRVEVQDLKLTLAVEDDGQGFFSEMPVPHRPGSMGLSDLHRLAQDLGGELGIESVPEGGARVALVIPLDAVSAVGDAVV